MNRDHYELHPVSSGLGISITDQGGGTHTPVTNLAVGPNMAGMIVKEVSLAADLSVVPLDFVTTNTTTGDGGTALEIAVTADKHAHAI
jgi:hypothetical protein